MNITTRLKRTHTRSGSPTLPSSMGLFLRADGTWQDPGGASLPTGIIVMWSGLLSNIPSGWNLCDGANGTPDLRDRFIKGAGAAEEPGGTGGAATHTHAAGTLANDAVSAGTPAGTNSAPTFTGNALASHTHAYTQIVNHTHPVTDPGHVHAQRRNNTATGANSGWTTAFDTSSSSPVNDTNTGTATATTGITTANPVGGVASGTTEGPSATLTPAGTNSAPTFTGSALGTHLHTITGSTASGNGEPAYYKLAFIMKAA